MLQIYMDSWSSRLGRQLCLAFCYLFFTFFTFNMNAQNAGNALDFDGTDDEVNAGDIDDLDGLSAATIECWVKFDALTDFDRLVIKETTTTTDGWGIALRASNSELLLFARNGANTRGFSGINSVTANEWIHIAYVFDGSGATNSDKLKCYINGVSIALTYQGTLPTSLPSNAAELFLGRHKNGNAADFLDGQLDEIRIWNDARTEHEVLDNMHKDLTPGSEANLVVYYKTDESSGATTVADSKNSHDGTWSGSGGSNSSSNFVTSNAPLGDATAQMQTNVRAVWQASGTNNSLESDGVTVGVGTALTETNFAVFGHDNAGTGTTTNDLGASAATDRFEQTWYVGEEGTVGGATVTFDLGTISGTAVTAGTASDYVLLFRAGTSGDFSDVTTGSSVANTDQVLFTGVALQDGYYTIGTSDNSNSPLLPVELLSFRAKKQNENILLTWQTASEINNDFFTVERSENGRDFISLHQVSGAGTTYEIQTYQTLDKKPLAGVNYYRLKQTDYDRGSAYSNIISVDFDADNHRIQVFPNPTQTDEITLQISDTEIETAHFELVNSMGQTVTRQTISDAYSKIDISHLAKGIYWLNIDLNGKRFQKKVVVK